MPFEKIKLKVYSTWTWSGRVTTLWRDGRAEKLGMTGEVPIWDYGPLCYLIEQLGFDSMEPEYPGAFDVDRITVCVWRSGEQEPIEVAFDDSGSAAPIGLWAIEAAIDGVASRIEWEEDVEEVAPADEGGQER